MHQVLLDGWVLRFSKGFTKRANSIVPLYESTDTRFDAGAILDKIRYCENLYAREQLQTIFRLTSITEQPPGQAGTPPESPTLDQVLAQRGYALEEANWVLTRPLVAQTTDAGATTVTLVPLDQWLDAYCQLTGMQQPVRGLHNLILQAISGTCGFAVLMHNEKPVACGLGVVERELLGLFDIFTHADHRRQGLAHTLITGLFNWAAEQGATHTYLQVLRENSAATTLYKRLGFSLSYEYWYRIAA